MTISKAWAIGIGVVLALAIALGSYEWLHERHARLKAQTQTAAQQKTIDQAKTDAQAEEAELVAHLAALEADRQQPATAQRIVAETSKLIPNLPQPITIQAAPQTAAATGAAQSTAPALADAPQAQQLVVPAADFKSIQNAEIDCEENAAKLDACTRTAADTATELKATTAQRDEWERTAKSGSWWQRTVTAAKWIGIGAAVGAGAGYAAHR
jgi:hypothetical protein